MNVNCLGRIFISILGILNFSSTLANTVPENSPAMPRLKIPSVAYQEEIGDAKRFGINIPEIAKRSMFVHASVNNGTVTPTLVTGNGIDYHGGGIMGSYPPRFHVIWYGNWTTSTSNRSLGQPIVENFLRNMGGTPWYNTLTGYSTIGSQFPESILNAPTAGVDSYIVNFDPTGVAGASYKRNLALTDLSDVVMWVVKHGAGVDNSAQYIVLTSDDVTWSVDGTKNTKGYPNGYCGMHSWTYNSNRAIINNIKWSVIANDGVRRIGCTYGGNAAVSPNGYPAVDAMVNVIGHEVAETVTDWEFNAWYDANGQEVGDKCNFDFGSVNFTPNGAAYNQVWNGWHFLVQRIWANYSGGFCTNGS